MPITFDDTSIAFSHKSNNDLKSSYRLFSLMNNNTLVNIGSAILMAANHLRVPLGYLVKPTIYRHFCGGETLHESEKTFTALASNGIKSMIDYAVEAKQHEEDFENTTGEIMRELQYAGAHKHIVTMKLTGLVRFGLLKKLHKQKTLSDSEQTELHKVRDRLDRIGRNALETGVTVYADAEESWIQDAMDDLVGEMMARFNKQKAIIYNTVQLYRHDRLDFLKSSYEKAQKEGYYLGMKLVRGAYLEKENARAERKGYASPIHPEKRFTDRDYDLAVEFCINHLDRIAFVAATHNEESCRKLVSFIETRGLPKDHPHIQFAQLYGMSDHISFTLSKAGYHVAKHVPYGPIRELVPYLIRRAKENTSIAGQMGRELALLKKEITRRKLL